ncbi:hypothetical protein D3C74_339970 [compost metagenome]
MIVQYSGVGFSGFNTYNIGKLMILNSEDNDEAEDEDDYDELYAAAMKSMEEW